MKSMGDALSAALKKRLDSGAEVEIKISSEKMGLAPDVPLEKEDESEGMEQPPVEMAKKPEAPVDGADKEKLEIEGALMGPDSEEDVMAGHANSLGAKVAQGIAKKRLQK